jgi:hypothetical protein
MLFPITVYGEILLLELHAVGKRNHGLNVDPYFSLFYFGPVKLWSPEMLQNLLATVVIYFLADISACKLREVTDVYHPKEVQMHKVFKNMQKT